jgi:DNA end-binding protein Ku
VDAETGDEVEQFNIIKGYEFARGEYVEVTPEELCGFRGRLATIEQFLEKSAFEPATFSLRKAPGGPAPAVLR